MRSPLACARPLSTASAQVDLAGRERDPGLGVGLDHGGRGAAGVADTLDHLDGRERRHPDLDRPAGRPLLEHGEEVLGQQPQVGRVRVAARRSGRARRRPRPGRRDGVGRARGRAYKRIPTSVRHNGAHAGACGHRARLFSLLSPLLAACGEDRSPRSPATSIRARTDDQFSEGKEVTVMIPTGRLLIQRRPIRSTAPVPTRPAPARTSTRRPARCWCRSPGSTTPGHPTGSTASSTPTTPRSSTWSATAQHYRLPPPDSGAKAGESFYVVVDGDGEDRDAGARVRRRHRSRSTSRPGRWTKGDAPALYDIKDKRLKATSCDEAGKWFDKGGRCPPSSPATWSGRSSRRTPPASGRPRAACGWC